LRKGKTLLDQPYSWEGEAALSEKCPIGVGCQSLRELARREVLRNSKNQRQAIPRIPATSLRSQVRQHVLPACPFRLVIGQPLHAR
jgi:hypothetical protein